MEKLKLGMEIQIAGKPLKVTRFHDEPNTGLCNYTYNGYMFTAPVAVLELFIEQAQKIGPPEHTVNAPFEKLPIGSVKRSYTFRCQMCQCTLTVIHNNVERARDEAQAEGWHLYDWCGWYCLGCNLEVFE